MSSTRTVSKKLSRGPRRVKQATSSSTNELDSANRKVALSASPSLGGAGSPGLDTVAETTSTDADERKTTKGINKQPDIDAKAALPERNTTAIVSEAKTKDQSANSGKGGDVDKKSTHTASPIPELKPAGIKREHSAPTDQQVSQGKGLSLREKLRALKRRRTEEESVTLVRSASAHTSPSLGILNGSGTIRGTTSAKHSGDVLAKTKAVGTIEEDGTNAATRGIADKCKRVDKDAGKPSDTTNRTGKSDEKIPSGEMGTQKGTDTPAINGKPLRHSPKHAINKVSGKGREGAHEASVDGVCKVSGRQSGAKTTQDVSEKSRKKMSRNGSEKGRDRQANSDRERSKEREARGSSDSRGETDSPRAKNRRANGKAGSSDRANERRRERRREREEERELDIPIPKKKNVVVVNKKLVTNGNGNELAVELQGLKTFRMCSPAPPPTSVQRQGNTITHTYTYTHTQALPQIHSQPQLQNQGQPQAYTLTNLRPHGVADTTAGLDGPQKHRNEYAQSPENEAHTAAPALPQKQTLTNSDLNIARMNGEAKTDNGTEDRTDKTGIQQSVSDADSDVEMRDDDAVFEGDYVSDSGHPGTVSVDMDMEMDLETRDMEIEEDSDSPSDLPDISAACATGNANGAKEEGVAIAVKGEDGTKQVALEKTASDGRVSDVKLETANPSTTRSSLDSDSMAAINGLTGSMECPYMPADTLGWQKIRNGVYLEIDSQGGGQVLHVFMSHALRQADAATQQLFVEDIVHESLSEDAEGYAHLCMTIMHGAGSAVPNVLNVLSDTNPRLKVIVESFGKAGYTHQDVKDYVDRIDKSYDSGVHQAGAMRNISLVGTVQEETGGYFPDVIDMLTANPFLSPTLPWGKLSSLNYIQPTESDDGPILWTRNGEQYYGVGDSLVNTNTNIGTHAKADTQTETSGSDRHTATCPLAKGLGAASLHIHTPDGVHTHSKSPSQTPGDSPTGGDASEHTSAHTHTTPHTKKGSKLVDKTPSKNSDVSKETNTGADAQGTSHSPNKTSPPGGCRTDKRTPSASAQRRINTNTSIDTNNDAHTHTNSGSRTGSRSRSSKGTLGYKQGRTKSARERLYTDRTTVHADFSGRFPYRLPVAAVGLVQGIQPQQGKHTRTKTPTQTHTEPQTPAQTCTCHLKLEGPTDKGVNDDAKNYGGNASEVEVGGDRKHKGNTTDTVSEQNCTRRNSDGEQTACERTNVERSTELFARAAAAEFVQEQPVVCKEVVAFSARHMETLERVCRIDYNEEPMDQSIDRSYWVDQARLRQLGRMGITYATTKLRSGDIYFIPRKIVHQFHTVAGCSSVAWHFRYEKYNEFKEIPKGA